MRIFSSSVGMFVSLFVFLFVPKIHSGEVILMELCKSIYFFVADKIFDLKFCEFSPRYQNPNIPNNGVIIDSQLSQLDKNKNTFIG